MLSEKEIVEFINSGKSGKDRYYALKGLNYYNGCHDIKNYSLYYYDSAGNLTEDKMRSNIKISHPFFTHLVDQQVQYILSGDYFFKSDDNELQKYLNMYFNENEDFTSELYDVITGAVVKGSEYMYAYINSKGLLSFQCADSLCVFEADGKYTSDGRDYVIYQYTEQNEKNGETVNKVQVWDSEKTYFYTMDSNGRLRFDKNDVKNGKYNPRPHVIYSNNKNGDMYYEGFGYIPFFRLDNNKDRLSGLAPVKELIDDYDLMSCGLSNNLQDASEYIVVVKGFQGDNLDELISNVRTKKHIGVDDGGDIDFKTVDIPYEARKTKLKLDEDNIYRFGMGFNSTETGDGNVTNIVIKSRYSLLDLKCNKLEIRLKGFLRKIADTVIKEINKNNGCDFNISQVYFEFDRKIMTNALDNATILKTDAERRQIEIATLTSLENYMGRDEIINGIYRVLDIERQENDNGIS